MISIARIPLQGLGTLLFWCYKINTYTRGRHNISSCSYIDIYNNHGLIDLSNIVITVLLAKSHFKNFTDQEVWTCDIPVMYLLYTLFVYFTM